jgi:hypothetical protein
MSEVLTKPKTPKSPGLTLNQCQINEKIFDIEIKSPAELKEKQNSTLLDKGKLILSALQSGSICQKDDGFTFVETFNDVDEKNLKKMFFETLNKIG